MATADQSRVALPKCAADRDAERGRAHVRAPPQSPGERASDQAARTIARIMTTPNGTHAMNRNGPTGSRTGSGCESAHPQSHAATTNVGAAGHHRVSQRRRSTWREAEALPSLQGHAANNWSVTPPRKTINMLSR